MAQEHPRDIHQRLAAAWVRPRAFWVGTSCHTLPEKWHLAQEVNLPCPLSRLASKTTVRRHNLRLQGNLRPSCKAPAVQPCTLPGSRNSRGGKLLVVVMAQEHPRDIHQPLLAAWVRPRAFWVGTSCHTL